MTKKEFTLIKKGSKVFHKHYGECTVKEIKYADVSNISFGIIIQPETDEGKYLLHFHSGTPIGTPLLESTHYLLRPINRPFEKENEDLAIVREILKERREAI